MMVVGGKLCKASKNPVHSGLIPESLGSLRYFSCLSSVHANFLLVALQLDLVLQSFACVCLHMPANQCTPLHQQGIALGFNCSQTLV